MRALGQMEWYGYRSRVPLTGREPIVGRLRNRLRRRGPGWGWVTVTGPWGAGVTRVLAETAALLEDEGGPAAVWVRPIPDASFPMEPIRRALLNHVGVRDNHACSRRLGDMLGGPFSDVDAFARWLVAGEASRQATRPHISVARAVLERLVPGGPILVDDFDQLDAESRAVLLPSASHVGPGVVAGITGDASMAPVGSAWALDPLADAQVELLLRRWLRHSATARRLTGQLMRRTHGWPGRVVEAVRSLARAERLVRESRGIVLKEAPRSWPDGRRAPEVFERWARALGAPAGRVLEVAALSGEPIGVTLLADAAGVKESLVVALLDEAAASRDGVRPDRFFPTAAARARFIAQTKAPRIAQSVERLGAAFAELPPAPTETACFALGRVTALLRAERRKDGLAALDHALDRADAARLLYPCDVRRLGEIGQLVGPAQSDPERSTLARLGQRLLDFGDVAAARALIPADERRAPLAEQCLRAAVDQTAGRLAKAHARLDRVLAEPAPGPEPELFDAFALKAAIALQLGDSGAGRDAWRCAGRVLPLGDLARRAEFHRGAAACAAHYGRYRAVGAHLRRAAAMLEALGDVREAADVRSRLGEVDGRLGRHPEAVESLCRAAHSHHLLGDAEVEAKARTALGRVQISSSSYGPAAQALRDALEIVEIEDLERLRPELHVELALAYRGLGDLRAERHHASTAASFASAPARIRLLARAMVAEADLRAGAPGAIRLLERCEGELRAAGLVIEADEARAVLFDVRLRSGDAKSARALLTLSPSIPSMRLGQARLDLLTGRAPEASVALESLATDPSLSIDVRIVAYAHLADALCRQRRLVESRCAAVSASALFGVADRSRIDDLRVHRILVRVFKAVGDRGRAVSHRAAARRQLRALLVGAAGTGEGRRLARAQWRIDPEHVVSVA